METGPPQETVSNFLTDLKRLYGQAFPGESVNSVVLLQKFLSDLRPGISQQVLLKGKLSLLEEAVDVAINVEQVLGPVKHQMKQVNCITEEQTTVYNLEVKQRGGSSNRAEGSLITAIRRESIW